MSALLEFKFLSIQLCSLFGSAGGGGGGGGWVGVGLLGFFFLVCSGS